MEWQSSEIALVDFIEKYIHKIKSPIFQYVFDNLAHRASQSLYDEERDIILEKGDALELVQFPLEALTIILITLLVMPVAMDLRIPQIKRIWSKLIFYQKEKITS